MSNHLVSPFLSLLISLLLICGTYKLGELLIESTGIDHLVKSISKIFYQKLIIGNIFSLILLFPLVAFTNNATIILKSFGIFLIFLGILKIIFFLKKFESIYFETIKNNFKNYELIILFLFFILACSPETSADSLDYHFGSALNILRFDNYILNDYWFTAAQSGSGETLIALGLSVGSEQFGSLIQFSSLLSITGIIKKATTKKKFLGSEILLPIIILTCPVLLFLASGSKPQLFFSSLLLICISLIYTKIKKSDLLTVYTIINILIMIAITGKFSFNLSGFLIWTLATYKLANKENIKLLLFVSILSFSLILLPFTSWKFNQFGGNLLVYFFSPFPLHLPGYDHFLNHIRLPANLSLGFPYFFFIPSSISRISETLGFSSIILIVLFLNLRFLRKEVLEISILIISFIFISNIYASPSARYYFDLILWSSFGIKYVDDNYDFKILRQIAFLQFITIFFALLFTALNFFPGSISKSSYEKVKNKYAYEYSGIKWASKNIPNGSNVIIYSRPISSYKEFSISAIFMNFTTYDQSIFYHRKIKKLKPEYYVTFGKEPRFDHMEGCIGKLFKMKENVGRFASRNPLNKGDNYNAYIYYFDYSKLPDCKKNN